MSGQTDGDGATLEFESPRVLFTVSTPKRWDLIERLQALGEISLRGLAPYGIRSARSGLTGYPCEYPLPVRSRLNTCSARLPLRSLMSTVP